jgi:hypothetical protein
LTNIRIIKSRNRTLQGHIPDMEKIEMHVEFSLENLKERYHLEGLHTGRRSVKWIHQAQDRD